MRDGLAEAEQGLHALVRMCEDVIAGFPSAGLAEQHHSRSAELEHGLLIAAFEWTVKRMLLHDTPDRERTNLNEAELPEIHRLDKVHRALVDEVDIGLVAQRGPGDRPEPLSQTILLKRFSVVGIM